MSLNKICPHIYDGDDATTWKWWIICASRMINGIGHVVVVTHALYTMKEIIIHTRTMNGGQLRPILCLSWWKVQFSPTASQLSINKRVDVCGFNSILSCLFSEVKFFVLMTQIRYCNFPHSQSRRVNSCAVCLLSYRDVFFLSFTAMLLQYRFLYTFFIAGCFAFKKIFIKFLIYII